MYVFFCYCLFVYLFVFNAFSICPFFVFLLLLDLLCSFFSQTFTQYYYCICVTLFLSVFVHFVEPWTLKVLYPLNIMLKYVFIAQNNQKLLVTQLLSFSKLVFGLFFLILTHALCIWSYFHFLLSILQWSALLFVFFSMISI